MEQIVRLNKYLDKETKRIVSIFLKRLIAGVKNSTNKVMVRHEYWGRHDDNTVKRFVISAGKDIEVLIMAYYDDDKPADNICKPYRLIILHNETILLDEDINFVSNWADAVKDLKLYGYSIDSVVNALLKECLERSKKTKLEEFTDFYTRYWKARKKEGKQRADKLHILLNISQE